MYIVTCVLYQVNNRHQSKKCFETRMLVHVAQKPKSRQTRSRTMACRKKELTLSALYGRPIDWTLICQYSRCWWLDVTDKSLRYRPCGYKLFPKIGLECSGACGIDRRGVKTPRGNGMVTFRDLVSKCSHRRIVTILNMVSPLLHNLSCRYHEYGDTGTMPLFALL